MGQPEPDQYDLVGNRLGATVNSISIGSGTYDAADQVVGWSYDPAGNLLNDGTRAYAYDPLGRLASTTVGGATTTFGYTGDGHEALRTAAGTTTRYTLDPAGGLVERLGATTSGVSTWYLRGWGQELIREQAGAITWLVGDRLGSVRGEYNSAGTLTTNVNYDPFGAPQGGTTPSDYGFTGEPSEAGGGLVQLRARWYAPGSGRFVSRDPFAGNPASPATLGPYAYAHNDPVGLTDPSGMCVEWADNYCREPADGVGQLVDGWDLLYLVKLKKPGSFDDLCDPLEQDPITKLDVFSKLNWEELPEPQSSCEPGALDPTNLPESLWKGWRLLGDIRCLNLITMLEVPLAIQKPGGGMALVKIITAYSLGGPGGDDGGAPPPSQPAKEKVSDEIMKLVEEARRLRHRVGTTPKGAKTVAATRWNKVISGFDEKPPAGHDRASWEETREFARARGFDFPRHQDDRAFGDPDNYGRHYGTHAEPQAATLAPDYPMAISNVGGTCESCDEFLTAVARKDNRMQVVADPTKVSVYFPDGRLWHVNDDDSYVVIRGPR